jgi:hypothetical protein
MTAADAAVVADSKPTADAVPEAAAAAGRTPAIAPALSATISAVQFVVGGVPQTRRRFAQLTHF